MDILVEIKKEGLKGNISSITTLAYSTKKEQDKVVKDKRLERYIEPFNNFGENYRLSINQKLQFDSAGKLICYGYLRNDDHPIENIVYSYDDNNRLKGWEDNSFVIPDYEHVTRRKESNFSTLNGSLALNKFSEVKTQYTCLANERDRNRKYFDFFGQNKIKLVIDYHFPEEILRLSEEGDPIRGKVIDELTKFELIEKLNVVDTIEQLLRIRNFDHNTYLQEDYKYGNDGLRSEKEVWFSNVEIPESNDDRLLSDITRIIRYNEILANSEPILLWKVTYEYLKFDQAGNWTELLIKRRFIFGFDEGENDLNKVRINMFLERFGIEKIYNGNKEEGESNTPIEELDSFIDDVIIERKIEYIDNNSLI